MKKKYTLSLVLVLLISIFWYYNQNEAIETSNESTLLETKILEPFKV